MENFEKFDLNENPPTVATDNPLPVESEKNWHNVDDPEWNVIANAFKSYTIEGAVNWLKYQGYKITKD